MTARHPPAATSATPSNRAAQLRVNEIFYSLQGESRTVGLPTVFIRLTGCPLRCGYCDTEYAFHEGDWMTVSGILTQVAGYQPRYVTVTGGEPLAQRPCIELLAGLCDAGYEVSLETSGAVDIRKVDPRVCLVMDVKTPGSGEAAKNDAANLKFLKQTDQVKFVICDRADYEWSRAFLKRERLAEHCDVLFSPAWGRVEPRDLAEWVLADRLPVRVQVQLHKLLWGETRGH